MNDKITRLLMDSDYRFLLLAGIGLFDKWCDKKYIERKYKAIMGKELNLEHPSTLNEKLQWVKLYDRNPLYTTLVDKVKVREVIGERIGKEYLIPTLGVWETPNDINFSTLPEKFVLKCNHNSGLGMVICRDKNKLDFEEARKQLIRGFKQNYYLTSREWPYKDVPHRIIGEQYMTDSLEVDYFTDYKFYCFDGYADSVMVCTDRQSGDPKFYFFDNKWQLKRYNIRGKNAPEGFTLEKPQLIEEMFRIAGELSKGLPFVRVDLYQSDGKVYFGELTFFPQSGWDPNYTIEADEYYGSMLKLPKRI